MTLFHALATPLLLATGCSAGAAFTTDTDSAADTGDGPCQDSLSRPTGYPPLYVNEFMAYDPEGDDWIEVYNCGAEEVTLEGISLWADDRDPQAAWEFPDATTLAAGDFLVVLCKGVDAEDLVASFRLAREEGTLYLYFSDLGLDAPIDHVTYSHQLDAHSMARQVDGSPLWVHSSSPTPGLSNHGSGDRR